MDVLEKKEKPKEEKPVVAQPEPKPDLECSPDGLAEWAAIDCRWVPSGRLRFAVFGLPLTASFVPLPQGLVLTD